MTPGYSLVQGSLSNLSGPYFLHATAKRSEIETISCQRSTKESQTQFRSSQTIQGSAGYNRGYSSTATTTEEYCGAEAQ